MGKKSQTTHLIEAFHRDWDDVQVGRQCLWWLSRPFEEVFSFLVFPSVVLWVENKEFVGVECLPLLYNWLKVKLRKRKQSLTSLTAEVPSRNVHSRKLSHLECQQCRQQTTEVHTARMRSNWREKSNHALASQGPTIQFQLRNAHNVERKIF